MLLNKNNFAIHTIASQSDVKPEISGVYITPEESVATDSFMLVTVSTPKGNASEFPLPEEGSLMKAKEVRAIIPASLAKAVMNKIPTKNKILPILENAIVRSFKGEKKITFASTDLEVWNDTSGNVIEGEFPKYKQIFPTKKPQTEISINHKLLKKAIEALARTCGSDNQIDIKMYGKNEPILITSSNGDQTTKILIMPIRT